MYGLHRLHSLVELNLSHNGILTIEGLKDLTQLTHLNLAGNNIKSIEHLTTNTRLEYLNLSENSIGNVSDISNLKLLKVRIVLSHCGSVISNFSDKFCVNVTVILKERNYEQIYRQIDCQILMNYSLHILSI